ncbi:MAG: protein kinase [Myxococcota bacterium]
MSTPDRIGPYRLLRPIATGGTAEVYEVQDGASGERLALKLLVGPDTSTRRFDREYEAMTRLNHPSIVRVYHYGFFAKQPWFTMELLRGVPAQSHAKRMGRPGTDDRTREVLRIGYHVSKALQYIHERKIVHRDLKSANVLVLPDDRVKLLDFGAASLLDALDKVTLEGEFVGTFAYASPEHLSGRPLDGRSDLYSLGVLMFRLATGHRPFESELVEDLVRMHLHETPPDPRLLIPSLPEGLSELIVSLLAKAPADRPATAEHVAQRLEQLHGRPFPSRSRIAIQDAACTAREAERRQLWEVLVRGEVAPLVLVDGDDGSDRIRLLDHARTGADERGWPAYTCLFKPGESLPSLIKLLLAMAADAGADAATTERLQAAADPMALARPEDRARLRNLAVSIARMRAADGLPVVVMLQEIHRAGPLALELVAGMRKALAEERVPLKLVASARTTDVEGRTELARRLLGDAVRIHLAPLSPREIAVGVGNMLGRRPPPADVARRLHEVSAGQPLYVEEAVRDMVDLGTIEADGNRLAWADQSFAMALPPPERAYLTATRMLEGLPLVHRRVLEAVALADDAGEPAVLARALGWSVPELGEVLERLVARGVLRWRAGDTLRPEWRHPVLFTLVTEAIGPCRRALVQRLLAEATASLPPSRGAVRALVAAGRTAEAAHSAVQIGRQQVARARVRTAVSALEPVVEHARDADASLDVAEAFLLHAHCVRTVQPTDPRSARSLARARALAEPLGDPSLLARTSLTPARLYAAIGHYTNYRRFLKVAWDQNPGATDAVSAEIATELAKSYRLHGDLPKAEQWAETAVALAQRLEDPPLLAMAMIDGAAVRLARGRLIAAEEQLREVITACERADDRPGLWLALARWATVLRHQGRYSEALRALAERMPEASQGEDPMPYVEQLMAVAWIELDLSRLGRAQECQEELAATIHRGAHLHLRLEAKILDGRILLSSGQYRQAAYTLQEAHRGARTADLPVLAELARAYHAEALFALGDREASAQAFQSALLGLLGSGDQTVLAEGCRGRARTQATERDPDEIFRPAQKLLEEQPMPLLKLERWLARGAWARAKGQRDEARRCMAEAGTLLNEVGKGLSDTDRAALRVHPWASWVRRGLGR